MISQFVLAVQNPHKFRGFDPVQSGFGIGNKTGSSAGMWGQDLNTKPPGENKLNGSQSTTLDTTCAEEQSHTNLQIVPRGHNSPEFLNLSSQTHFGQITPQILFKFAISASRKATY